MNFMAAADSRFFLCMGVCMVYEIESRFEYRNEYHASSRSAIFYVWAYGCCMRLNVVLNIEMNFMPAVDYQLFSCMGIWMVYAIECRFEYRNEFHASRRFVCFPL